MDWTLKATLLGLDSNYAAKQLCSPARAHRYSSSILLVRLCSPTLDSDRCYRLQTRPLGFRSGQDVPQCRFLHLDIWNDWCFII